MSRERGRLEQPKVGQGRMAGETCLRCANEIERARGLAFLQEAIDLFLRAVEARERDGLAFCPSLVRGFARFGRAGKASADFGAERASRHDVAAAAGHFTRSPCRARTDLGAKIVRARDREPLLGIGEVSAFELGFAEREGRLATPDGIRVSLGEDRPMLERTGTIASPERETREMRARMVREVRIDGERTSERRLGEIDPSCRLCFDGRAEDRATLLRSTARG
jgi:hypothetical protein